METFDDFYLFNLAEDYHELHDQKIAQPERLAAMNKQLGNFLASIQHSQRAESKCVKVEWSTPMNCTTCERSGTPLRHIIRVSLDACKAACVEHAGCTAITFRHRQESRVGTICQLYSNCKRQTHASPCEGDAWWTTYKLH